MVNLGRTHFVLFLSELPADELNIPEVPLRLRAWVLEEAPVRFHKILLAGDLLLRN